MRACFSWYFGVFIAGATLYFAAGFGATQACAQSPGVLLDEAERLMDEGAALFADDRAAAEALFSEAGVRYDALTGREGIANAALYRASGNAHRLGGETGLAVLAYRRAQELDPTDGRTREALEAAHSGVGVRIEPGFKSSAWRTLLFWRGVVPRRALLGLMVVGWCVFWALLIVRTITADRRLGPALIASALCVALGGVPLAAEFVRRSSSTPVVLTDEGEAFTGPSSDIYESAFDHSLPSGTEADLLETRHGWARIALADGRQGWVRASTYEPIRAEQH